MSNRTDFEAWWDSRPVKWPGLDDKDLALKAWQAAWAAATAAERERCAEMCEQWNATHPDRLAAAIRKG